MHAVIQQLIPHRSQSPFLYIFTAGQTALGYVGPRRESLRSIVRQFAWDNDEEQHTKMDFTQERVVCFLCINCIIIVYTKFA